MILEMYDLDVPSSYAFLNIFTDPMNVFSYIFLAILLLLSGFFAGTETAFSYCNKHRLKVSAEDGSKTSKMALKILDKFDAALITTSEGDQHILNMDNVNLIEEIHY